MIKNSMKHLLSLLILLILTGCATTNVHNKYFEPSVSNESQFALIKNIKWAKEKGDSIYLCIYGELTTSSSTDGDLVPASKLSKAGSKLPYIEDSNNTYMISIAKTSLIEKNRDDGFLYLQPTTIQKNCDINIQGNIIQTYNIDTQDLQGWIKTNTPNENFIYNYIIKKESWFEPKAFYSSYVYMDKKNNLNYNFFPSSKLKIKTEVTNNTSQKVTGTLLYPFAVVFDVITFPIQLIVYLVIISGMA